MAGVVAAIAQYAVPAGQWPELLVFLGQCGQSAEESHREVALTLFASLAESIPQVLRAHHAALSAVCAAGIQDASLRVRRAAVGCVGAMVRDLVEEEEEAEAVRGLLPALLQARVSPSLTPPRRHSIIHCDNTSSRQWTRYLRFLLVYSHCRARLASRCGRRRHLLWQSLTPAAAPAGGAAGPGPGRR